jgi:hypothetical protein
MATKLISMNFVAEPELKVRVYAAVAKRLAKVTDARAPKPSFSAFLREAVEEALKKAGV